MPAVRPTQLTITDVPLQTFAACALLILGSSVVTAQSVDSAGARLQELVGLWRARLNTFAAPGDTATLEVASLARGHGVRSTWRQRFGAEPYEATSTWAYDSATKLVRVFEVNSLGLVADHVGRFDASGTLVIDRTSSSGSLLQRSWFRWRNDSLWFTAEFHGRTVRRDSTILVRHPSIAPSRRQPDRGLTWR